QKLDVVFPVLHGKFGEDGTIQGLLQMSTIAYVGCDTLASASCMDKAVTHTILTNANIKNAKYEIVTVSDADDNDTVRQRLEKSLGYPMYIKPANAGSSIGINMVSSAQYLNDAINIALTHDKKVVAEAKVTGTEVECAVLGNDEPIASCLGEIIPCNDFYDYEAKYISGNSQLIIPAQIDEDLSLSVQQIAIKAYKALGCSGLARVDFFVNKETKEIILNEINTIPGFTAISMYPKLFAQSGLPYNKLLDTLIELAIEKNDH
ncbi:MAG: D-alanine--D-alanine ligase family protein, partial [Oscillospiraceae bacterium]